MAITIREIAKKAGVSRGTVDKVLNNRYGVSDEVRERVLKIATEYGYKPNLAGKVLAYQKKNIKIGMIIVDKNDKFFQDVYKGAKKAYNELKDFGISVEFCIMDTDNVEEQLQCIDDMSRKNISALIITPLNDERIANEITKLSEEGIKVVIVNTDIKGVRRLCFVGQDLKKSGRVAGHLIGEMFPNGGKVAIITGEDKYEALKQRIDGFVEIINNEYTKIKIVDTIYNIRNNEEAYVNTVSLFNRYPDLDAVFITTAKHIEGIGKAIRAKNKGDLKYVCYDIVPEIIQLIREKIIDFALTQDPYTQGYQPIKILFDYFFQDKVPSSENYFTRLEIITKENIPDYI